MDDLMRRIGAALDAGQLLESSAANLRAVLEQQPSDVAVASLRELVEAGEWGELNDRFFRTLAFGTGGLRGRTIGKIVTVAERGQPDALGRPEHPCIGTNAMNFANVSRATQGLANYAKRWFAEQGRSGRPKIAIAHDTRHFSRDFAELAARVATELGCDVLLVEGPRSTPELSFAVRHCGATAGVVLTASHNPPHDNGYKVYFEDGGQVVEPHAGGIIAEVNAVASERYVPSGNPGRIEMLGAALDAAYMDRLASLVVDPEAVAAGKGLKIVYSSLHGTGGVVIVPMLARLGFACSVVPEQEVMDGRFPTVRSPNPENAEALALAIAQAEREGADLVLATDPDCDRMGAAVRAADGGMRLITGNQIGSLIVWYRVARLVEKGVITPENAGRCVVIKTFVTTDLQKAIAEKFGLRCVETLTGFKYIGAKMQKYEMALPGEIRARYRSMTEGETACARLGGSSLYVAGGEESYGYSGADFVRDKDGNGAAVMFAEVAAYAKSRGLTLDALLDEIYAEFGYYLEKGVSLQFDGADGAAKIAKLAASYAAEQPSEIAGQPVAGARDFSKDDIRDVEGDLVPKEKMMIFDLADGTRVAVRPSGTEPKIKYYLFGRRVPSAGARFSAEALAGVKGEVEAWLDAVWAWLKADVDRRLG
jgi:phosphoglucomutase